MFLDVVESIGDMKSHFRSCIQMSTALYGCEIIWRLFQTIREYYGSSRRYDAQPNRLLSIVRHTFSFNMMTTCSIAVCTSWLLFFYDSEAIVFRSPAYTMLVLVICMLYNHATDVRHSQYHLINDMRQNSGLNIATFMAYSYFDGYLRIVLPSRGDNSKGLRERMEDHESSYNTKFALYKLIVLIPSSSYLSPNFNELSDDIDGLESLETIEIDRCGVIKRKYNNSVYKILSRRVCVVAEGATVLNTLYKMTKDQPELLSLRNEIVYSFYEILKDLIWEDRSCRNLCVPYFYEDCDEFDQPRDMAEIIKLIIDESKT